MKKQANDKHSVMLATFLTTFTQRSKTNDR